MPQTPDETTEWAAAWLQEVADGTRTMSQRQLALVEARQGGLAAVKAVAEAKGVHLAVFTDDRNVELLAASRHPIRVIC